MVSAQYDTQKSSPQVVSAVTAAGIQPPQQQQQLQQRVGGREPMFAATAGGLVCVNGAGNHSHASSLTSPRPKQAAPRRVLKTSDYFKSFVCGGIGGMCGCVYSFPLDTVKVRAQSVQLHTNGVAKRLSYRHVITSIYHSDGVRGFYRGISAPMLGVMFDNAVIFTVNSNALLFLERMTLPIDEPEFTDVNRPIAHIVAAGLLAGVASATILTPFELVKCRVQLARVACGPLFNAKEWTSRRTAVRIVREGGWRALFTGYHAACCREVPGTATWFISYQLMMRAYNTHFNILPASDGNAAKPSVAATLLIGGLAGCAYWTVSFPGDVVKTRIQSGLREFHGQSFFNCLTRLARYEGIRGLYRGYSITMLRAFPSNGIIFTAYQYVSTKWDKTFA